MNSLLERTSCRVAVAALVIAAFTGCTEIAPDAASPEDGGLVVMEAGMSDGAASSQLPDSGPDAIAPEDDAGSSGCSTDAECSDGLVCNGLERCDGGRCAHGEPMLCTREHPCSEQTSGCDCRVPSFDGDAFDAKICGGKDCDDSNADIRPGGREVCDSAGVDEDCDPTTFNDERDGVNIDGDDDHDEVVSSGCWNLRDDGKRNEGKDCRDNNPSIKPGATEVCDYEDNDCNETVDEAPSPHGEKTRVADGLRENFYPDLDQDGYSDKDSDPVRACAHLQPPGYIHGTLPHDCDDRDRAIHDGVIEECDGVDNDCDGLIDAADDDASPLLKVYDFTDTVVECIDGDWAITHCPDDRLWCSQVVDQGCTTDATQLHTCRACETDCHFSCGEAGCDEPTQVSAGEQHTCALTAEGRVACFGRGAEGRLGNDGIASSNVPVEVVGGLDDVHGLAAGENATCAVNGDDHELYCWGSNADGLLANADAGDLYSAVPLPVPGAYAERVMADVIDVAVGPQHACAVLGNGALACWGLADDGRLGNGEAEVGEFVGPNPSILDTYFEVDDATAVTVGGKHGCMIGAGGIVRCWGDNSYGQLGDPEFTDAISDTVRAVPDLDSVTQISAGLDHTCALREGEVLCWGSNNRLQLGRDSDPDDGMPAVVEGLGEVSAIGAGERFTCALETSGSVYCWGGNEKGERGDEDVNASAIPNRVAIDDIDTKVVSIGAGSVHACALTEFQQLWCWGRNPFGQLGDGESTRDATPVPVRVMPLEPAP